MKSFIPPADAGKKTAPPDYIRALETDVLARTLWGEARGEGALGMRAVAAVVLNRVAIATRKGRFWWGNSILQVCHKPYQFSCWNKADQNFKKISAVDERDLHFATALRIARRAVIGKIDDPTHGATHYHTVNILPFWAKDAKSCARIGNHIFYKLEV